jgi:hypothetical protein
MLIFHLAGLVLKVKKQSKAHSNSGLIRTVIPELSAHFFGGGKRWLIPKYGMLTP